MQKARARDVPVSDTAFRDPKLAERSLTERSRHGHDDLRVTVRENFVPFEEALQHLLDLVGSSGIPTCRRTKQGGFSV